MAASGEWAAERGQGPGSLATLRAWSTDSLESGSGRHRFPSDFGAAAGWRLGHVRLSPRDVWGEGKVSFPSPSHPFHPVSARLERGVMMDSGLSWSDEAQKDLWEAWGLLTDVKHCARVEEGRRRLARGRVHSRLRLRGARPLRTGVGAGE